MKYTFSDYKSNIQKILAKLVEIPNWKINIVSFNDQSRMESFSDKENSIEDIKKYVETLNADGYTRLYGTVKDALELLKEKIDIHSTIIVFTDGKNEGTDCNTTQQEVIDSAIAVIQNPQFNMYAVGFGENYNKEFFEEIAMRGGFTHISLRDPSGMKQLEQYIDNIEQKVVIWKILGEQLNLITRVQEGDVFIGDKVDTDKEITFSKDMNLLKNITGKNYINGEFVEFGKQISIINPSTLKEIATVPNLGLSEINSAINNTVQTFSSWSQSSFEERIAILRKWYNLVIENIDELSHILTLEQGKVLSESKKEILYGASFIDWYTYVIHNIHGTIKPGSSKAHKIVTQYEPVGPVAAITPWNFPNAMITRKVVPAIAAGCSVILKPSSLTPLSALILAKFASDAGLPAGVFNVITGDSDVIGKAFCEDFRLRKLSFTGSTNVGKILYQNAANTLKRLSLELGGNAPFIITADNNLEKVVSDLVIAKTRNSGQSCTSPNRIFIEESIYEKFIEILKAKFTKLKSGDGFNKASDIGPLINSAAIEKIQNLLADAQNKGAKLICGGKAVDNFIEPTIIIDCLDNMDIFRTEIFGPVVACYKFKDLDEVIERANNTEYGLQGYVYSNNISVAQMIATRLDFGMVSINNPLPGNAKAPFAGRKASGFGVEGSFEGIFEYQNTKYINLQN